MPVAWTLLHDYQRQRVITFLDPERDPLGAGYHTIQAKIAPGPGQEFSMSGGEIHPTPSHFLQPMERQGALMAVQSPGSTLG